MYDVCVYLHVILTSLCNRISLYVQCMGIFTCIIIHTQSIYNVHDIEVVRMYMYTTVHVYTYLCIDCYK